MRVGRVLEEFRTLTATYFSGAAVKIGRQSRTAKPRLPLVSITSAGLHRVGNPVDRQVDGELVGFYPSRLTVQVDLFTHGRPVVDEVTGKTVSYENSALEDMLSFADFLNSQYALEWSHQRDLAILLDGDVQDMTGLVNDNNYEYRSRLTVLLYFTQMAVGHAAVLDEDSVLYPHFDSGNIVYSAYEPKEEMRESGRYSVKQGDGELILKPSFEQTSSGGGNAELAEELTGFFAQAEIEERNEV